ncbi:MAG: hypothetical protein U0Q22_14070 [Acidimicrobiales bacterium]
MPEPLERHDIEPDAVDERSALTAIRMLAFGVTALAVSFLVVGRTTTAIADAATSPVSEIRPGTVKLSDDDGDASLFPLGDLLPGRELTNCITVTYAGTSLDGDVDLTALGGGALAPDVAVTVQRGTGGRFDDCEGFVAEAPVFDGTLADLTARHGLTGEPLRALHIDGASATATYRVGIRLTRDDVPSDAAASLQLVWSVEG